MKNLKLLLLSTSILFSSQVFAMEISQKDLNQIKAAIQAGADLNAQDNYGYTALINAAYYGQLEVIKYLIQAGADLNAKNKHGKTALMLAAAYKPEVVKYLIDYCQSNNIKLDLNAQSKHGYTALMSAAESEKSEPVKYLIQAGADLNAQTKYGYTALMLAAAYKPEVVKYLIQAGAYLNAQDNYGETALMHAAYYGQSEAVKYLIQAGADLNAKNKCGRTVLISAVFHGQTKVVKYLIQAGADLNAKNKYGQTALISAAHHGQTEAVKYLTLAGSDLSQIKNKYKDQYQNTLEEIKKWIFKNYPKDRNKVLSKIKFIALSVALKLIKDSNGNTLLHYAAIKEDIQLFGLIYSICPSLIATANDNNQIPFDLVFLKLANGRPEIFNLLKKLSSKNNNQNQEKENFEDHQSDDDDDL